MAATNLNLILRIWFQCKNTILTNLESLIEFDRNKLIKIELPDGKVELI